MIPHIRTHTPLPLYPYCSNLTLRSSEAATDTPKPARKRVGLGGRFPIRPSISGADTDTVMGPSPNSPQPTRPGLKSSKTTHVAPTQRTIAVRPSGVEPLISKDRHRSSSESQMSTNRRQKRMGIHVSRGGSGNSSAEISLDGVDLNPSSSSHARGTSAGSLLHQVMQHGATDSEGPESPATADLSRSASLYDGQGRLPNLPEATGTSTQDEPIVQLSETVIFCMSQVEGPIKMLINCTRPANYRRRSMERSCTTAFAARRELDGALYQLERLNEGDNSKGTLLKSMREQCEGCVRQFQQLLESLQSHISSVLDNGRSRDVRMMMQITLAVVNEVKIVSAKAAEVLEADGNDDDELQVSSETVVPTPAHNAAARQATPSPRPTTSLRVKDRGRISHHHHQSSNVNKPLPSPRSARSASGASMLSRMPSYASSTSRYQEVYTPPTPSLTHSNSFMSTASTDVFDHDEEDQQFEYIFKKLSEACQMSSKGLLHCRKIFHALRRSHSGSTPAAEDFYELLLRSCDHALDTCTELKSRLKSLKIREPQARRHFEFWQVCAGFIKAYFLFATTVRNPPYPSLVPEEVRTLLRPVQKAVKEASTLIDRSPWRPHAFHGPNSAGPSPSANSPMPFSMSNPNPPPMAGPPAKELPPRPNNYHSTYAQANSLGGQTSWSSTTTLARSDTQGSSSGYNGTLKASGTSYSSSQGSTTPVPGNLSRSQSRANAPQIIPPTSNPGPPSSGSFSSSASFVTQFPTYATDPPPPEQRFVESRYHSNSNPYGALDPKWPMSDLRGTPTDSRYGAEAPRSATSSGFATPLPGTPMPVTPMSAALGHGSLAPSNGDSVGTVTRSSGLNGASGVNNIHEKQNSWDNVTNNNNATSHGYPIPYVNSYANGGHGFYAAGSSASSTALSKNAGAVHGTERPEMLPRSVSAAGYYPASAIPSRMGSRNVSRSTSQRR